jgi:hypothetical protein
MVPWSKTRRMPRNGCSRRAKETPRRAGEHSGPGGPKDGTGLGQSPPMRAAIAEAKASNAARPFGRLTQMRSMSTVPYPWARRFRRVARVASAAARARSITPFRSVAGGAHVPHGATASARRTLPGFPCHRGAGANGSSTSMPVRTTSFTLRVTSIRSCTRAVAASNPSTTGKLPRASSLPHSSAVAASTGSTRSECACIRLSSQRSSAVAARESRFRMASIPRRISPVTRTLKKIEFSSRLANQR